jgi:hypothetical protein
MVDDRAHAIMTHGTTEHGKPHLMIIGCFSIDIYTLHTAWLRPLSSLFAAPMATKLDASYQVRALPSQERARELILK